MWGRVVRAVSGTVSIIVAAVWIPASAGAEPVLVFPGMEIHQGARSCTLGYVDPGQRVAVTAGHCHAGGGQVLDRNNQLIGTMGTFRDSINDGAWVNADQQMIDFESIVLAPDVTVNNILPGGRVLVSDPGLGVAPGQPVCHYGVVTGESCGAVQNVFNGWFDMGPGIASHPGDSGGPVYVTDGSGTARIVGIFNAVWGNSPSAVTWQSTAAQIRGAGGPSL